MSDRIESGQGAESRPVPAPEVGGAWRGPRAEGIELRGADRQRFLQGLVTCEVKSLAPGAGAYGFFTTGQGKVLADFILAVLDDRLFLAVPPGHGESLVAHLAKYVVADRVEIARNPDLGAVTLFGAARDRAAPLLPGLPIGADALAWSARPVEIEGRPAVAQVHARWGTPATTLWFDREDSADVAFGILSRAGAAEAAEEAVEAARVNAAMGRFGQDFDARHFPQETGAEEGAVSYTKGCYLGQEIVARLHYRGQAQNALTLLEVSSANSGAAVTPAALLGAQVLAEEAECGTLTSAAHGPEGTVLALAMLHRRSEGKELTIRLATASATQPAAALSAHRLGRSASS